MAQGIWVRGSRPKSKKEVREAIANAPHDVSIEATSFYGNEFEGRATELPLGSGTIYFVGPDPYKKRNIYGQIYWKGGKLVVE